MRIRSRRWLTVVVVCVAALLSVLVVAGLRDAKSPAPLAAKSGPQTIPGSGGTRLSVYAYVPNGKGPFPLIVMPASWGSAATEYASVAYGYAALDYVVVGYAQRGFSTSTGQIDLAGPGSQADVSEVIDWAFRRLPVNHSEVGAVGTSYGAGVALLAAEKDPRIKAVVALSGWTDLDQTIAPGGTISLQTYRSLFATVPAAKMTPDVRTFVMQLRANDAVAALASLRKLSATRSAINGIAALNKRGTAVMIGDAYQDSLLPPGPVVTFFDALTAPKRLELAVGDHAGPALSGLLGHKSPLWENAARWTDRYLLGHHNGIEAEQPVQLEDATTAAVHGYASWAATGRPTTVHLSAPASGTGGLAASARPWSESIATGVTSAAGAGPEQFTSGQPYREPTVSVADILRAANAVWAGPDLTAPTLVSGVARLHMTVTVAGPTSLFAYLYDVDGAGSGRLMSYGTVTVSRSGDADVALEPISWTLPSGHHVALVVDSVDPRFLSRYVPGSAVQIASSASDPATLAVPLG
jgi:putative CocE/NonD family hydrolase